MARRLSGAGAEGGTPAAGPSQDDAVPGQLSRKHTFSYDIPHSELFDMGALKQKEGIRNSEIMTLIKEDPREFQKGSSDFFANSDYVENLDANTYEDFKKSKDVVMIFYYDPWSPDCCWSKKHYWVASRVTNRKSHAFGAINCTSYPDICDAEEMEVLPAFKLWSGSFPISTIREYTSFTAESMQKFMENCPVLDKPLGPKPCQAKDV